jgi:hypothetical protein
MASNFPIMSELERKILGALCTIALLSTVREHAVRALAEYEWISPDHRVIYEALRRFGHRDGVEIREHLKAEVTRLGFPDIEWAPYFEACNPTAADVDRLVRELLNAAPYAPNGA